MGRQIDGQIDRLTYSKITYKMGKLKDGYIYKDNILHNDGQKDMYIEKYAYKL